MSEVVVVAVITAQEGKRDEIEAICRDVAIPETHERDGCVRYALHRDVRDDNVLVFIERWRDAESLDVHVQSSNIQEFLAAIRPLCAAPAAVHRLEATGYGDPVKGSIT